MDGHEAALNIVLSSDGGLEYETVVLESVANISAVKPGGAWLVAAKP